MSSQADSDYHTQITSRLSARCADKMINCGSGFIILFSVVRCLLSVKTTLRRSQYFVLDFVFLLISDPAKTSCHTLALYKTLCSLHSGLFVVKTPRGDWKFQLIIFQVQSAFRQKSNSHLIVEPVS